MNGKILILLVTLVFLFASGCAEEDNTSSVPDDPDIPVPEAGNQRLALGRTTVHSKITYSEKHFSFAVLYLGQLSIIGNISLDMSRETFDQMAAELVPAFLKTDLGVAIGLMQKYFHAETFNISHLFKDE